jgi:hypothetical protein
VLAGPDREFGKCPHSGFQPFPVRLPSARPRWTVCIWPQAGPEHTVPEMSPNTRMMGQRNRQSSLSDAGQSLYCHIFSSSELANHMFHLLATPHKAWWRFRRNTLVDSWRRTSAGLTDNLGLPSSHICFDLCAQLLQSTEATNGEPRLDLAEPVQKGFQLGVAPLSMSCRFS